MRSSISSKKRTKTIRILVKTNSFVRFLEEIDDPINLFEINLPLPQVNFPANNLNFHSRLGWWDWIQAIFLKSFLLYCILLKVNLRLSYVIDTSHPLIDLPNTKSYQERRLFFVRLVKLDLYYIYFLLDLFFVHSLLIWDYLSENGEKKLVHTRKNLLVSNVTYLGTIHIVRT